VDNLTHSLAGLALARAGLGRLSPGATVALVVGSNLPDIDVLTSLAGSAEYLQHHRDLSHSVVGAPLLALALALALRAGVRGARLPPLLACSALALAGHVFMDLWTSYGTRVLAPFDRSWYTWDVVFIVDPLILLALAAGVLWSARQGVRDGRPAAAALALALAYVGARTLLHARAVQLAREQVPEAALRRLAVMPTPLDPTRWRVLADTERSYWTGELRLGREPAPLVRRDKRREDALVTRVRETSEVAAIFLEFSSFPWLEVEEGPEGTEVSWRDLRFERRGEERFVTRVLVGHDGRIRSEEFRF
jgi:inner membrane protein